MRTENVVTTEDGATDQAPVREDMSAAVSRAIMRHAGKMLYKARWQLFPWAMIPIVFVAAQFWRTELFWTMFSTGVVLGLNGRPTSVTMPAIKRTGRWSVRPTGWVTIPYTIPSIPVPGLSQHEQRIWSVWLTAASTWAALEPLGVMAWWSLTAMVSAPSIAFMWSRRIRTPWWDPRYWALKRRMLWMRKHETTMHDWRLAGPTVTFKGGVTRFAIALPPGFHSGMVSEVLRLKIETYFTKELGACIVDTGENNQRIHVKVAPLRGKFTEEIQCDTTERTDPMQTVNIGIYDDREPAEIHVSRPGGIRHIAILGSNGSGKSHALELLTSGLADTDTIMCLDGKGGGSMGPQMQQSSVIAKTAEGWRRAIRLAHGIMVERQRIDGENNIKEWGGAEHWRPLRVVIDEPNMVSEGLTRDERTMLKQIATAGRSVAVGIILCSQDLTEKTITGAGAEIREQVVSGGSVVLMRPSEKMAERVPSLTQETIARCRDLKPGEPGFGVIVTGGSTDPRILHTASTDQLIITEPHPLDQVGCTVRDRLLQEIKDANNPTPKTPEEGESHVRHETKHETTQKPRNLKENEQKSHETETQEPPSLRAQARAWETNEEAYEWCLSQGIEEPKQIMEQTGMSRATVYRIRKKVAA